MKVDLEKLICSMIQKSTLDSIITKCLKDQGIEYKDGSLHYIGEKEVEKPEPVNFEDFPREKQLKWYICTKSIPQKDGGFMPLFCEGEHATIEKIFDMFPELKNDTTLFTEHFRKVTEDDLPKKPDTIKFEPELSEFEDRLGEIVIPTWNIAKGCEECKGDVEDVKKWAKELLDIAHRQFSKEEANNDTYTESELCLMSPYQLCKILEGHSVRIKIGDNYADLANGKKTFRMYKFSRLFGSVGYDIVEFETGKNPYISYHLGLGEDPYIKEDDDECTNIVHDEYRESIINVLIDGILKRQIKKG